MVVAQEVRTTDGSEARKAHADAPRYAGGAAGVAFVLLLATHGASAIGLGPAQLRSGLGEPLRLALPVTVQEGEDVGCVQIKPHGDDLPAVFNTRVAVVQARGQTRIEITSAQPVNEPAVGLIVSVGCVAPVARDYVLFLDPPFAPVVAAASEPVVATAVNRSDAGVSSTQAAGAENRPARARRATQARRGGAAAAASGAPARSAPLRSAAARAKPHAAKPVARETLPRPVRPPATRDESRDRSADRLTVAPVEEPRGRSNVPGATGTVARDAAVGPTSVQATAGLVTPPPIAATSEADPAAGAAAHDDEQQRQQRELQRQIKTLGDQILALQKETAALNARNRAVEEGAFPKVLNWLFALLALLAIAVAAWMAWRYRQLRSMVSGDPWYGNTVFGANAEAASRLSGAPDGGSGGVAASSVPTRTSTKTSAALVSDHGTSVPHLTDRAKPATRVSPAHYTSAIESDFTVSDIEAAMATVRTVPPQRKALEDSDFAPLGGPSLPAPYADPPPAKPAASRANEMAKHEKTEPLDLRLDIPASLTDPLATTSNQITEVEAPRSLDFELPFASTPLDFELPLASSIGAPSDTPDNDVADDRVRHAATALNDIFPPLTVDTILRLDDPAMDPMTTEVEASEREAEQASLQFRLVRFADLIGQIDEAARTDPLRAISQLRQYVLRDEQIPTLMWLRLFELYRRVGKKPVYEALAEHFARRFHRPMTKWDESLADRTPQIMLAELPEIDKRIESQWGSDVGLETLRSLLFDRDQPDAVVFNAVLQRDLLEAAKVFPLDDNQLSNIRPQ